MKLSGAKAEDYFSGGKPLPITLVYGANQSRIRKILQRFSQKTLGKTAREEMRSWDFEYKELAKDPAQLGDTLRSVSFFPGKKGVLLYGLTDAGTALLEDVLKDWQEGDGMIFAQAGSLKKTSKLRKAFEGNPQTAIIAVYEDPVNAMQIARMVDKAGLHLERDAMALLTDFVANYDLGGVEALLEGIAIYQGNDKQPMDVDTLQKLLPGGQAAAADEIVNMMMRGEAKQLVTHLRRAPAQGISFQQINAMAMRRVHTLIKLQAAPDPRNAIGGLRPPIFGARRQAIEENLRKWTLPRLEAALISLSDVEKTTRLGKVYLPEHAYIERIFLRITMMAR